MCVCVFFFFFFFFFVCFFFFFEGCGGWGRGRLNCYIWHSADVRAEWPPFSALPGIWLAPFFQQNVYEWPDFSGFLCERPHFSDILVKIFAQRFFEAACSLGIKWIDCDICLTINNKWVQKIKGQYMNRSTFRMIKYMNGSVFSKARYMNGVGFETLARTPVPQLRPPPPPPPPTHTHTLPRGKRLKVNSPFGVIKFTTALKAGYNLSCNMTILSYGHVLPAKTQISLDMHRVWTIFAVHSVDNKGSKTSSGRQQRLIGLCDWTSEDWTGWFESPLSSCIKYIFFVAFYVL